MRAAAGRTFAGMRRERGQATVEWVGIVLLVALALAALSHFAPRADGRELGRSVARSVIRPAVRQHAAPAPVSRGRAFPVPPLIPRPADVAGVRLRLPRAPAVLRRARRGAGVAWRRAWIACLVYERFRYAFMHPDRK